MNTIHIIYNQFFDMHGCNIKIGGVETYISNLIEALKNQYNIRIYQFAEYSFEKKYHGAVVKGCILTSQKVNKFSVLVSAAEECGNYVDDILIFGADICIVKSLFKKKVAIQHGIGWDIPLGESCSKEKNILHFMKNIQTACSRRKFYRECNRVVCVDYNYLNWYRTFFATDVAKIVTIPNFSNIIINNEQNEGDYISIIFARRFQQYRGTRIFSEAVKALLINYPDIRICFAGEGPDEEWLHDNLDNYNQIQFIKFLPEQSFEVHKKFDIAVIPSTGSEGTSLSLLEAMAAGCVPICSDVGGLTNIVIDGFNGRVVRAEKEQLYNAMVELIENKKMRREISISAKETVRKAFSFDRWKDNWLNVLNQLTIEEK